MFTDKFGRVHDKPTDGVNPSSNNGWYYSAVVDKLGLAVNIDMEAAKKCAEELVRHPIPVENCPPISREEIMGLAYFGALKPHHLKGWNFSPYPVPKFNLVETIKQANSCVESYRPFKLKHRNTFWQQGYSQLYRFAFSVPFSDRHFLNKCWGRYNLFWHIVHILTLRKQPENRSSRMVRYLKTGQDQESVINYFRMDHVAVEHLKEKDESGTAP